MEQLVCPAFCSRVDSQVRPLRLVYPGQSAQSPLTVVFVHADLQPVQAIADLGIELLLQLSCNPPGDFFGGRVADRKQHAIFFWEHPTFGSESDHHFVCFFRDQNERMLGRNEHVVIQLFDEFLKGIAKGDEIDNVTVLIKRPFYLGLQTVVVSMQTFTDIARKGDEMGGREDQLLFLELNSKGG
jgi:hypothetical protein